MRSTPHVPERRSNLAHEEHAPETRGLLAYEEHAPETRGLLADEEHTPDQAIITPRACRQLDIVLIYEGFNYVLKTPRPFPPLPEDPPEEYEVFKKCNKVDEMTRCYILASLSNVLQSQHLHYLTSADIMLNLKEMFGQVGKSARQTTMTNLMTTKMVQGTPVQDHALKMIGFLNELKILGCNLDSELQVDMIIASLLDSLNSFRVNYSTNKLEYSLAELLNELVTFEGIIKSKGASVNYNQSAGPSTSKPKRRGKKKKNDGAQTVLMPTKVIQKDKGKKKVWVESE
ncbi:uncharacterized protein LOC132272568 [Cornus florida]|uniref:uncharacterized protein LOC132272568 n=1 Tax=Cornus florida TaxID=4283 RepID=UPI0028997555|nr:uncharacterized protein LOC132272568 [Cornus florida]